MRQLIIFFICMLMLGTAYSQTSVTSSNKEQPLYVIDDMALDLSSDGLSKLDPGEISKVLVLKGDSSTSRYGELGQYGIIMITTHQGDLHSRFRENYLKVGNGEPLYIIDGKRMNAIVEVDDLDPNNIDSITVLKGFSNVEKYGKEAVNGVILITTKS